MVMIYPNRPISEAFRKRLVEYVYGGGKLLVIDAGLSTVASTSNQILRPFGLSLDYLQPWNGELAIGGSRSGSGEQGDLLPAPRSPLPAPSGIYVASAWKVVGGTSLVAVHAKLEKLDPNDADTYVDESICAAVRYGQGLVMVVSFGNMFNDSNLGNVWWNDPTPAERRGTTCFSPSCNTCCGTSRL